jgi:hypothetical protein
MRLLVAEMGFRKTCVRTTLQDIVRNEVIREEAEVGKPIKRSDENGRYGMDMVEWKIADHHARHWNGIQQGAGKGEDRHGFGEKI